MKSLIKPLSFGAATLLGLVSAGTHDPGTGMAGMASGSHMHPGNEMLAGLKSVDTAGSKSIVKV